MPLFRRARSSKVSLPVLGTPEAGKMKSFGLPVFWATSDPDAVKGHLAAAAGLVEPGFHFADNMFTWARNDSMLDDGAFMKAWRSNTESSVDEAILWRRYILACAGYHYVQLPGDFVECGAYTGVGVKTVIDYVGGKEFPKTFRAYNLFVHETSMAHHAMPGHGEALEARVRANFKDYLQVKIVSGAIPGSIVGQSPSSIAYLHIDLNEAPAEIAALDALFDRVVPGGIVILDDYEWAGPYRSQKLAEDAWFQARGCRVIPLPAGQGIVIKR